MLIHIKAYHAYVQLPAIETRFVRKNAFLKQLVQLNVRTECFSIILLYAAVIPTQSGKKMLLNRVQLTFAIASAYKL